jgi:Domain of unknown function (DUF5664)
MSEKVLKFEFPPSVCIDCWRLSHKECPEGYTEPSKTRMACKNHIKDNKQDVIQCHDCIREYTGSCPQHSDTQRAVIDGTKACDTYYKRNKLQKNEQKNNEQTESGKGVKYDGDKPRVALVLSGFMYALESCSTNKYTTNLSLIELILSYYSNRNIRDLILATNICISKLQINITDTNRGLNNFYSDNYDALMSICKVGTFGAKKYADNNWMGLEDGENRTLDAAMRHIMAYVSGEINNHEEFEKDGVKYSCDFPHLAHAAWELLACLEFARYRLNMGSTVTEAQNKLKEGK